MSKYNSLNTESGTGIESAPAYQGYLLALTATVIWSGNFVVARILADSMPPVTLAFSRWTVALVFLLPFEGRNLWRQRDVVMENLLPLSIAAFLGVTLFNSLLYMAGHTSNALNMSLIAITTPIFIVLFSRIFLGERAGLARILGIVVAGAGILLLITQGHLSRLTTMTFTEGDILMIVAAASFAGYTMFVRVKSRQLSQGLMLSSMFLLGTVMLVPWVVWEQLEAPRMAISASTIGAILYIGVGASLISFICWNRSVSIIGPASTGMIYYSLPLFSGVEASLLLGEPLSWLSVFSGVLILVGILLATRTPDSNPGVQGGAARSGKTSRKRQEDGAIIEACRISQERPCNE